MSLPDKGQIGSNGSGVGSGIGSGVGSGVGNVSCGAMGVGSGVGTGVGSGVGVTSIPGDSGCISSKDEQPNVPEKTNNAHMLIVIIFLLIFIKFILVLHNHCCRCFILP